MAESICLERVTKPVLTALANLNLLEDSGLFYQNLGFWWYRGPHPKKGKDHVHPECRPGRQKTPVRSGLDKPLPSLLKSINSS
jgi:hypothetical protein